MQKIYTNIGLMATPTEGKHLVNKEYVDAAVNRKLKDPVVAVATQELDATYNSDDKRLIMKAAGIPTVDGVTLDTTPLSFAKFKGSEDANVFTATITGDGVAKEFPVTHGLNSEAVVVSVVDAATKEQCMFGVVITSPNVITLKSDVVLENTDSFIVTVIG